MRRRRHAARGRLQHDDLLWGPSIDGHFYSRRRQWLFRLLPQGVCRNVDFDLSWIVGRVCGNNRVEGSGNWSGDKIGNDVREISFHVKYTKQGEIQWLPWNLFIFSCSVMVVDNFFVSLPLPWSHEKWECCLVQEMARKLQDGRATRGRTTSSRGSTSRFAHTDVEKIPPHAILMQPVECHHCGYRTKVRARPSRTQLLEIAWGAMGT